jgi:hypothetical protein
MEDSCVPFIDRQDDDRVLKRARAHLPDLRGHDFVVRISSDGFSGEPALPCGLQALGA